MREQSFLLSRNGVGTADDHLRSKLMDGPRRERPSDADAAFDADLPLAMLSAWASAPDVEKHTRRFAELADAHAVDLIGSSAFTSPTSSAATTPAPSLKSSGADEAPGAQHGGSALFGAPAEAADSADHAELGLEQRVLQMVIGPGVLGETQPPPPHGWAEQRPHGGLSGRPAHAAVRGGGEPRPPAPPAPWQPALPRDLWHGGSCAAPAPPASAAPRGGALGDAPSVPPHGFDAAQQPHATPGWAAPPCAHARGVAACAAVGGAAAHGATLPAARSRTPPLPAAAAPATSALSPAEIAISAAEIVAAPAVGAGVTGRGAAPPVPAAPGASRAQLTPAQLGAGAAAGMPAARGGAPVPASAHARGGQPAAAPAFASPLLYAQAERMGGYAMPPACLPHPAAAAYAEHQLHLSRMQPAAQPPLPPGPAPGCCAAGVPHPAAAPALTQLPNGAWVCVMPPQPGMPGAHGLGAIAGAMHCAPTAAPIAYEAGAMLAGSRAGRGRGGRDGGGARRGAREGGGDYWPGGSASAPPRRADPLLATPAPLASCAAHGVGAEAAASARLLPPQPPLPPPPHCHSLADAAGRLLALAEDQLGSRWVQTQLEHATDAERAAAFAELEPHAPRLMSAIFGNYVVHKFLCCGSAQMVDSLARALRGSVVVLALHTCSCRVVQKVLEVAALEHKLAILAELRGSVLRCVRDQNGNHVIQKAIEFIPAEYGAALVAELEGQAVGLAVHSYGCRVLQRVLEHSSEPQKASVLREVLPACDLLCRDQYGNFVMQHAAQLGGPGPRAAIAGHVLRHARAYSSHKYASNVVEKVLQYGSASEREALVAALIGGEGGPDDCSGGLATLHALVHDQFGNYVIQRAIDVCSSKQRAIIAQYARLHIDALRSITHGKHILSKLEKHQHLPAPPHGHHSPPGRGGGGGGGGGRGGGSRRERGPCVGGGAPSPHQYGGGRPSPAAKHARPQQRRVAG